MLLQLMKSFCVLLALLTQKIKTKNDFTKIVSIHYESQEIEIHLQHNALEIAKTTGLNRIEIENLQQNQVFQKHFIETI